MSIGINDPRYVMTAKDHVGYYRWARELEEKLQKQRELKQNDEPGLPPSDCGAFQPAQKAPDMEGECSHQASRHQETTIEKKTQQIHEIMRECWEETEGTRHGKDLEVLRGHLRRVLFLKRKKPSGQPGLALASQEETCRAIGNVLELRHSYLERKGIEDPFHILMGAERDELMKWAKAEYEGSEEQRFLQSADAKKWKPKGKQSKRKGGKARGRDAPQLAQGTLSDFLLTQKKKRWRVHLEEVCGTKEIWEVLAFTGWFHSDSFLEVLRLSGQDRDAKEKPQIVHRQQRRDLHHARVKARADSWLPSAVAWQQRVGTGVGWHGGASGRSGRLAHGWVPPPWRKVDIAQEVQDGGASQPAKSSDTPEASVTEDARILKKIKAARFLKKISGQSPTSRPVAGEEEPEGDGEALEKFMRAQGPPAAPQRSFARIKLGNQRSAPPRRLVDACVQTELPEVGEPQEVQDSGASQPADPIETKVSLPILFTRQFPAKNDEEWRSLWRSECPTGEAHWNMPVRAPPPSTSLDPESLLAYNRIRKYLGGCGGRGVEHYFDLFGETRIGTAPFGSDVWAGIRELAAHDDKLRHYREEEIHFGWFQAPYPFKKKAALLPTSYDEKEHMQYPAVFVKERRSATKIQTQISGNPDAEQSDDDDIWKVRCVAILIKRARDWYAHNSRVMLCGDDMSVIPPLLRGRGEASQPGAIACRGW